jgi:hypothetical protein
VLSHLILLLLHIGSLHEIWLVEEVFNHDLNYLLMSSSSAVLSSHTNYEVLEGLKSCEYVKMNLNDRR